MNFDSKIPTLKFQHSQIHRVTHNSVKYILHVLLSVKYLGEKNKIRGCNFLRSASIKF